MNNWIPFASLRDVLVLVERLDKIEGKLLPGEAASIANAVPARVREFTAGRTLARTALTRLGAPAARIATGPGGQPLWPAGVAGSISHGNGLVAVAVAWQERVAGIGIDLETQGGVGELESEQLLTAGEAQQAGDAATEDLATTIFSCKESVFKAVYPAFAEAFEFLDLEIAVGGETFRARAAARLQCASLIASGRGYVSRHGGVIASIFLV